MGGFFNIAQAVKKNIYSTIKKKYVSSTPNNKITDIISAIRMKGWI